MHSTLTLLGLAYDKNAEICTFAIGFDKQWIGSVNKVGRFFRANIGDAKGTGLTPLRAAEAAWRAKWGVEPQSSMNTPPPADGPLTAIERVSVKTIVERERFQVLIGGKRKGEARRQQDGSFVAVVGGTEHRGCGPIEAARLAWAQSKWLV